MQHKTVAQGALLISSAYSFSGSLLKNLDNGKTIGLVIKGRSSIKYIEIDEALSPKWKNENNENKLGLSSAKLM